MKRAILLVAYGSSCPEARSSIHTFESACRQRFPQWCLRWAFTSCLGRERLAAQRQKSDSVYKALMRLGFEGFDHIALQPLQTIAGCEHEHVREAMLKAQEDRGNLLCSLGKPLLHSGQDLGAVAAALMEHLPGERQRGESVIFMGHGARHRAGDIYAELARVVHTLDEDVHIGTMHAICALDQILPVLRSGPVWLLPLLSTVGQHAIKDMAGMGADSWRSRIEKSGHECRPMLRGTAESPPLRQIWLNNLAQAMAELES